MDKIARVRQYIESLYDGEVPEHDQQCDFSDGYFTGLSVISNFLDTLSEEPDAPEFPETFEICLYDGRTPDNEKCTECSTTCSVRKEEPDKNLEEAAEEYRRESFKKSVMPQIDGPVNEYGGNIKDAFIAGAEWQKSQMISALKNDGELPIEFIDKFHEIDRNAFQNGQKNMKEQMLKDAVEGYVNYYEDSGGILMAEAQVGCPYHNGDKVRIVVLKAGEE